MFYGTILVPIFNFLLFPLTYFNIIKSKWGKGDFSFYRIILKFMTFEATLGSEQQHLKFHVLALILDIRHSRLVLKL